MLPFKKINFGHTDAVNFALRKEKQLLNNVFFKSTYLDEIANPLTYFLIGEKGTGKTTYAVFMSNNNVKGTLSNYITINQSDYVRFYRLMQSNMLAVSKYEEIWTTILLQYTITSLQQKKHNIDSFFPSLKAGELRNALKYYDEISLAPEKVVTREIIEESEQGYGTKLAIGNKIASISDSDSSKIINKIKNYEEVIQSNIFKLQIKFKEIINSLKLRENLAIFLDGIDVRPEEMSYSEYIECISGLASAAWNLNNSFFGTKKDSKGLIRIVLLLRPDIFSSIRLHNSANKILDNSVYLNWETTFKEYKDSEIFSLCEHVLGGQQEKAIDGNCWDKYFPWKVENGSYLSDRFEKQDSFIEFLRISYSRPRDIIAYMQILQKFCSDDDVSVSEKIFTSAKFRNKASEYLLQTIRDYTNIYLSDDEFFAFRNFFPHLRGRFKFTWREFQRAFEDFTKNVLVPLTNIPDYFSSDIKFLQFLYNSNVICYIEPVEFGDPFIRWCYRERKMSNLRPMAPIGLEYKVHNGLRKALNLGRHIRQ